MIFLQQTSLPMEVTMFVLIALIGCASLVSCAIESDRITDLPGLTSQPSFKQYSGYLTATGTRKLHYWFVESQNNPSSDPVVLWVNGGPGCSSMDGLLNEHGPFLIADNGQTLVPNPYSWNTIANVLYLEAPAGVGFSYSDDKNYNTSDDQVSMDNYAALKAFFSGFSEFSQNEFFITGESYGGIYVPTLSLRVVGDSNINFKGFAVGNGITDWALNQDSMMYLGYFHGFWGKELWSKLVNNCCKNGNTSDCDFYGSSDPLCVEALNEAGGIISTLNIYNIYEECYQPGFNNAHKSIIHPLDSSMWMLTKKNLKSISGSSAHVSLVPPCVNVTAMTTYLNSANVRQALHIPDGLPKWEICSAAVGMAYQRQYQSMKDQYQKILATKKHRILVYNGDVDMACNFLMDQWFTDSLNQPIVKERKAWYYMAKDRSSQIAGYVKQFENLTYLTVKGAGHMVPQDKPIPALEMFTHFIQGKPY